MPDGVQQNEFADEPSQTPAWRAALPEALRDAPALVRFDDVGALAREHVHLQSMIGRKGLVQPGQDASPDEWDTFYNRIGRPPSAADYDLQNFTPPEGVPWSDEMQSAMLAEMHAAGLTNTQATALVTAYAAKQSDTWNGAVAARDSQSESVKATLKAEWGESFDSHVDLAGRAFRAAFGDDFEEVADMQLLDGSQVGDHPAFVRAFAALGEQMAEPQLIGSKTSAFGQSAESARVTLKQLENDPDFRDALLDRSHPDHRSAMAKRSTLSGAAYQDNASTE